MANQETNGDRVRRVMSPSRPPPILAEGTIAGKQVDGLFVGTGADKTIIKTDFIPQDCYTGKSITLDGYDGKRSQSHPLALVDLEVGQVKGLFEVAVAIFLDQIISTRKSSTSK